METNDILSLLKQVNDPELKESIVELGMLRDATDAHQVLLANAGMSSRRGLASLRKISYLHIQGMLSPYPSNMQPF